MYLNNRRCNRRCKGINDSFAISTRILLSLWCTSSRSVRQTIKQANRMLPDRLSRKVISTEINNYLLTRTLHTSSEFKIESESDHKSNIIERVYVTMYNVCVYLYVLVDLCVPTDVRNRWLWIGSLIHDSQWRVLQGDYIDIYSRFRHSVVRSNTTSVESKCPNSVHILSETSLSFYLSYLIYRWPIYRVIFFLHESIIRRYWPTWISIVFIGFTGSRMYLVYCAIISPSKLSLILKIMSIQNSVYFRLMECQWLIII